MSLTIFGAEIISAFLGTISIKAYFLGKIESAVKHSSLTELFSSLVSSKSPPLFLDF